MIQVEIQRIQVTPDSQLITRSDGKWGFVLLEGGEPIYTAWGFEDKGEANSARARQLAAVNRA